MSRENLKQYKLKITALSPIHIGTGEVYEPTNYTIDENRLFLFDEILFYKSLSDEDKIKFNQQLDDYMQIIDFYKSRKDHAKKISYFECRVSNDIQNAYNKQKNKDGSKNKNQLEIERTFKNPNTFRPIIPGSSIKGMLNTALQIYPKKIKDNDIRQELILSDAILLNGSVEIGRADRKHKNPSKQSKGGIYQRVEVIKPNSEFILSINSRFTFDDLKTSLRRFHSQRINSRYEETNSSFISRVGKNEGKEYVVDDGRNVLNSFKKPVSTHFLYNSNTLKDEEFGWVKIELISDTEYEKALKEINLQEQSYYKNLEQKQSKLKGKIQQEKEKAKKLAFEKKQKEEQQAKEKAQKEAAEKARLESLSPIDRLIESYEFNIPNIIKDMQDEKIKNFDDIKKELAQKLKILMQENPKNWEKAKKKALVRKEYIQKILDE